MDEDKLTEFKRRLQECIDNSDTECTHGDADDILCEFLTELGHESIVELYEKVNKWYG